MPRVRYQKIEFEGGDESESVIYSQEVKFEGDKDSARVASSRKIRFEGDEEDSEFLLSSEALEGEGTKILTVAEAVEHIGMGLFQVKIIAMCAASWFTEQFVITILAILGPALKCEWLLSDVQVAFLTTAMFIGFMIFAPIWGSLADHYGRRKVPLVVHLWMSYYGLLTAFSPTYFWVLLFRGFVGAGSPGTFGSITEIALAAAIMLNVPPDSAIPGWRILGFVSAIPLSLSFFVLLKFLPESARFFVAAGRGQEALDILNEGARLNKQPPIPGKLKPEESEVRGSFRDLFKGGLSRITVGSWLLWFTAGLLYYGALLLSAIILDLNRRSCAIDEDARLELEAGGSPASPSAVCSCTPMSASAYYSMIASTFGEMGASVLNFFALDGLGRKKSMVTYLVIEAVCFFLLIPCHLSVYAVTALLFVIRALSGAFFGTVYIYVAEVYPTKVRSLGLGSSSAAARVGCIITPFVAQVLIEQNRTATLVVYGSVALVGAVVALLLAVETRDRQQTN